MKKIILLFILYCISEKINSQSALPEFGVYSNVEMDMKECSFDKDADAIVLLDEAFSNYDDGYQLITTRRIRIKILNERGIDRGNITIPIYSKDGFEYIRNIEGLTYNDNGASYLNKKSIYTENVDKRFSNVKFALPNVKSGSIIEYKYESVMKHYGGLDHWVFQSDIPTMRSCYLLQIIPNAEFSYVVTKKKNYPIIITPKKEVGQIYFEMNNIPSLQFEPYMDAPKDYLQKVEFQFSGYINVFGSRQSVNETWKALAYTLATDKEVGGTLKKDLPKIDEIKLLVSKETTNTGKLIAIYNYVRNHLTWNGYYGIHAADGIKKIWESRTGSAGEINLVLISLLQTFGIEASPLLIAERDFGKIDPAFPFIDRFNKTAAYAVADGKTFIMDATQKYCPPGLTPYPVLNTYALVVDKKTMNIMQIKSDKEAYKTLAIVQAVLDKNGLVKGSSFISAFDYAKELQTEQIRESQKNFVKKYFEDAYEGLSVDSFSYDNLNSDTDPLTINLSFNRQLSDNGGFVLLNYNFFTGLGKNPFKKDERFTNVNFGYPYQVSVDETIELPANSKVEEWPSNKKLTTPGENIFLSRDIKQSGNSIHIRLDFIQTLTLVPADSYPDLKSFYKQMIDMLNEPIIIKLGK